MSWLEEMTAIGFTEYEAKVYLELLNENPATGYQISKKSGVPRSMVYEALGRLEARGAVLKNEDRRATLYRPIPPDVLLDRYEKEHLNTINNLRETLRAAYQTQHEDHFWTIKGRGSVISYAAQLIDSATDELMLVLSDADVEALRENIEAAHERKAAINALMTGTSELDFGEVAYHPPLESELHGLSNMLVVVADRKQVLIASADLDTTGTITNNHNMVIITHQFVWMELFTQRINRHMEPDLLERLDPEDREIFESLNHKINTN